MVTKYGHEYSADIAHWCQHANRAVWACLTFSKRLESKPYGLWYFNSNHIYIDTVVTKYWHAYSSAKLSERWARLHSPWLLLSTKISNWLSLVWGWRRWKRWNWAKSQRHGSERLLQWWYWSTCKVRKMISPLRAMWRAAATVLSRMCSCLTVAT